MLLTRARKGTMMVILILHVISLITLTGSDSGSTFPLRRREYHFVKHSCQMLHYCILQELFSCSLFQEVGWPWPATNYAQSHSLVHSSPVGWGEKIGRKRARKLVCCDKDSLIDAGRGKKTPSETKGIVRHIWQTDISPAGLQIKWPPWKPKPRFELSFYCWVLCHTVQSKSLASLGQQSWLCPNPVSCPSPAYSLWGKERTEWEKEKAWVLCEHCSGTAKTLVSYQHCFSHKSKVQPHTGCYEESWLHPSQIQ